jgi:hypothetical protein
VAASHGRASVIRLAFFGVVTVLLYTLLFVLEEPIMAFIRRGHWAFVLPIAIAFLVSYFHGAFTGGFWEVLGIKAKK